MLVGKINTSSDLMNRNILVSYSTLGGSTMNTKIVMMLVSTLMKMLSPELVKEFAESTLTWARKKIEDSETKTDDIILLPLLDTLEKAMSLNKK